MSSVASTSTSASASINPGLADVLNILSNSGSPALSSLLSSSKVQSALKNASPADLVQLSDQALQLQAVDSLFGNPDTSQSNPTTTLDNIFANQTQPSTSIANQLAIYQGQLQSENTQALFGTTTGATGTSINVLG